MKQLLTLILLFSFCVVKAQYIPNANAYQYKGLEALKSLQHPTGCGNPTTSIHAPDSSRSATYFDSCNNLFYIFNPKTKTWSTQQSGIDSIFITTSDSIFIITSSNDTIFIGTGNNGMDTAYTRSDSIFGVKNSSEFLISTVQAHIDSLFITNTDSIFIITSNNDTIFVGTNGGGDSVVSFEKNFAQDSIILTMFDGRRFAVKDSTGGGGVDSSAQYHTPGYGLLGDNYNTVAPVTWDVDTSIIATKDDINIIINADTATFIVSDIVNAPTGSEADGTKYLVGTSPTGVFTGHANQIATLISGTWNFEIPTNQQQLIVDNSNTYATYIYNSSIPQWIQTSVLFRAGGNTGIGNPRLGVRDNRGLRIITHDTTRINIDSTGDIYLPKFIGSKSISYLYPDSLTGKLLTDTFHNLIAGTGITISGDTISAAGSGPHNDTLYFNVEWFGAVHDSVTDDGPAIQAGVDYIHNYAPGAILFFPQGNYRDTSHVHWKSNVNALGEGEASNIFNDLSTHTRFGDQGPIFWGNMTPASWDSTDLKYFSVSYSNANKVKVVDSINRFSVGDIVIMRGATYWINTDGEVRPHVVRVNRVTAKIGDTLFLEEPLDTTITKIAISGHYIAGSGKRLDVYGVPAGFISDCNISNLKLTSVYGDVALGNAMFKCNFDHVWTSGKESLGGNGESFCTFDHIYADFSKQAWESSIGTHNTSINFLRATWNGITDAENKPVVKFGESIYKVEFTNLDINANGFGGKGIWFGAATHCSVNGFTIKGEAMNDNLIEFSNTNNVISNTVRNGKVFSSTSSHYVEITKNAGVNARLSDNLIESVKAYGNTGATGVLVDGTNTTIKDSYFEDGNLGIGDSAVNYMVDNTTINGGYYLAKSNRSASGIMDITGGLHLTTSAGSAGTDSVLVQSGGIVKRISPTYYGTGSGGGSTNSNIGSGYRLAVPNTNNIKTLHAGTNITMDSVSNANEITINASTGTTQTTDYQTATATGGQTAFTFTSVPATASDYWIDVNGAVVNVAFYSVSGNTITFTGGLIAGDKVGFHRVK